MKRMFSVLVLAMALALMPSTAVKAQTAFPLLDTVEDDAFSTAAWVFSPEDSPWLIRATAAISGDQAWSIVTDATRRYLVLAASIDLTAAENPKLAFWLRSLDGQVNYTVDISSDGGTNWEVLQGNTGYNNTEWNRVQWSVEDYRTPDVLVRIGVTQSSGGATLQLDDILIDDAPVPTFIRMTEPTNNGFTISWGESTADDFSEYRIDLATQSNFSLNQVVSGRSERRVIAITDKAKTDTTISDLAFINTRYFARIFETDTQGLSNQGSETAQSQTTFRTTAEVAPFAQDFEGEFQWAADLPWAVTNQAGNESGHSASQAWEDSPIASGLVNYPASADRWLVAELDLSGVARPLLRFNHRYTFEDQRDWGYVDYSTDNVNWANLAIFTSLEGIWQTEEYDLSFLGRRQQVFLRFRVTSNGSTQRDGWHIDDVEIAENTQTLTFPFSDGAEDQTQSEANWTPAKWEIQSTAAHSGDRVWSIRPYGVREYLTLAGTMDLTQAANPVVSFWLRSLDGQINYTVDVSTDGGTTWEALQGNTGYNNTEWTRVQWSLENFRTPNVLIRIGAIWSSFATLQLDDILINDAPVPTFIRMTEPTNNGFTISWGESTADDFSQYLIDLDTGSDFRGTVGVIGRRERRVIAITDKATTDTTISDLAFVNTRYFARIFETDTQGLSNQGSERTESQTTFRTTAEVAPFVQDFEGAFQWAADLSWAVTNQAGNESGHSANQAWEDSPIASGSANYPVSADRWLVAELDLSGVARPLLRFNHRYTFEDQRDWGYVDYSTDNVNWANLAIFTSLEGIWQTEEYDLSFLGRRQQVFLRFRVTSNGSTQRDGWHIDDVEIAENTQTLTFPFSDGAEDQTQSEANWTPAKWEIQSTAAHSGDRVWSIRPYGVREYLTLAGTMDLTQAANPVVSFWLRSLDGQINYTVDVSTDGGTTWEALQGNTGYNNTEWTRVQWSLENFRTPNVLIRIGAIWSSFATLQLDDFSIDFPPTITGDISGDGEISALDASVLLQYIVGLIPLGSSGLAAADVTGNGTISPLDATFILQFAVGLISQFPADTVGKLVAGWGTLEWAEPWRGSAPDQVVVPLVLSSDARNVRAVQYRAQVDADLVEIEDVLANLPADWQMAYNYEGHELRVVMAGITPVEPGELAQLKLRLRQPDVPIVLSGAAFINENASTSLAEIAVGPLPAIYSLAQNYPNPFNPTTQIQYRLPEAGEVHLSIHNLVGQKVRTLVEHMQPAGMHTVEWDGRDEEGRQAESGVYLYRIQSSGFVQTKKMVLVQ